MAASHFAFIYLLLLLPFSALKAQTFASVPDTAVADVIPEYPGGVQEFFKYISKKFKTPASAGKSLYQGSVLVTMIVDQDGRVIVDSLNYGRMAFYSKKADEALKIKAHNEVDTEIRRMFSSMPNWRPGSIDGRPIRVKYTMPLRISFQ
ncbi:hypothetical protein [Telluribacter sp.]|jgi:hypothetical protein|uniref:energy transducer TonB n=1 Tax=Telluribacter sp. TaxID=1978767 RepID=UPI002E0E3E13|nr:hypothetical protein [Telluribacter sp.]